MTDMEKTKFCTACGNSLVENDVICPKCGSATKKFFQTPQNAIQEVAYSESHNPEAKDKTTAVLLAVFLGVWSFLYTFRADARAFWLGLFAPFVSMVLAVLSTGGSFMGWQSIIVLFVAAVFSVLAIVRQATRTLEWYARYPDNGSIR